ncbi:uncharacterized protein BO95DRAFT_136963 [Aspergillus brunneoviolaceus CBS 621.78]|uniref:Uncharacterized protein n=1 Tax=Aspergillus brunneoviolaceus CBS 621.78 TaxID=1450534 RepID=A0ACD1G8V0_9EURO|nr:hypothetical protein BO95DRAFT_136963 [Aspergillus brunneoviolaceus CBS 621.78]RAH45607.1 hypothetical protein BO95DRAFT_136963 [Aspergillus brunneoviolaceus CBS 621.78]
MSHRPRIHWLRLNRATDSTRPDLPVLRSLVRAASRLPVPSNDRWATTNPRATGHGPSIHSPQSTVHNAHRCSANVTHHPPLPSLGSGTVPTGKLEPVIESPPESFAQPGTNRSAADVMRNRLKKDITNTQKFSPATRVLSGCDVYRIVSVGTRVLGQLEGSV